MPAMDMVSFAQIITIMLSIAEALYFGYNLTINKFKDPIWEPFWVTMVEVICYGVQLGSGSYRFAMADGAMVNIISPTAWCLACPVAMSFMMRISWPEASPRTTLALIMNLEAVLLLGIISGMTANMNIKIPLLVCSCVLYVILCTTLLKGMFYTAGVKRPTEAKNILLFFMSTWMIFPIVWILGPSTTGVWSYELSLTFFAFGDIFSKNIFTYIGYRYTMNLLEAEEQLALENGNASVLGKELHDMNRQPQLVGNVLIQQNNQTSTPGQNANSTKNSHWNTMKQAVVKQHSRFVKTLSANARMSGIAKDHEESVDFTILSTTVEHLPGGMVHTFVCAKNDTNNHPLEFTVVQNGMNEVIFCDLFHSIEYRFNDLQSDNKSYHPSLMPASPTKQLNGLGNNESFTMFPLPQELDLYAWKDGKSMALKIMSSKVINLDDGREGNTILAVDANGELDTFIIVTSVDNSGNRLVMSCKYDQLSLSPSLQNGGLFPNISDSASNISTRSNMSTRSDVSIKSTMSIKSNIQSNELMLNANKIAA